MRVKKKFWLYVVLAVLYIAPYIALFQSIGKGDIKGGFDDEDRSNSTLVVTDTTNVIAPTATSEQLLRYDEVVLERADTKLESKSKSKPKSELIDTCSLTCNPDSAPEINLTTKTGQEDSVEVKIPITQKVYEDSTYKVVVRGYNPELVSLDIYNRTLYYPVVEKVEVKPKVAIVVGPYFGVDKDGLSLGLSITLGIPIWSR